MAVIGKRWVATWFEMFSQVGTLDVRTRTLWYDATRTDLATLLGYYPELTADVYADVPINNQQRNRFLTQNVGILTDDEESMFETEIYTANGNNAAGHYFVQHDGLAWKLGDIYSGAPSDVYSLHPDQPVIAETTPTPFGDFGNGTIRYQVLPNGEFVDSLSMVPLDDTADADGVRRTIWGTSLIYAFGPVEGEEGEDPPEEVLATVDDSVRLRVWPFHLDGHDFYVLRVGSSTTLVYDLTTGQWAEWQSPDRTNWRAHVGQNWIGMLTATFANGFGSDIVAGDDLSGVLWILDPTAGQDDNVDTGVAEPFDRIVTGGIPLDGREVAKCNAVTLSLSLGNPALTGADITLETSDDMGQSWTDHGAVTVTAADYSAVVEWRSLGLMRAPGRVFRITDNGAAVRLSAADLR